MVATERLARSRAERRLQEAEDNLSVAEGVVREMQQAMQDLHHARSSSSPPPPGDSIDSPTTTTTAAATAATVALPALLAEQERGDVGRSFARRPLRTSHLPFDEFHRFVEHLRALRPLPPPTTTTTLSPSSIPSPPPLMASLLSQPLIARLLVEDHEPALRLDLAPGVGWISRKGLVTALVEGRLAVEPVRAATVWAHRGNESDIVCALSGKLIIPSPPPPPPSASVGSLSSYGYPGEGVFALAGLAGSGTGVGPPPSHPSRSSTRPPPANLSSSPSSSLPSSTVFVFRIAPAAPSSSSSSSSGAAPRIAEPPKASSTLYPVEPGWSLDRLRATCELWHFVRTGLVLPIWTYEDGTPRRRPPPPPAPPSSSAPASADRDVPATGAAGGKKPELPPRKKSWGLSAWGLGRSSSSSSSTALPTSQATSAPKVPPRRLPPPAAAVTVGETEAQQVETFAPPAVAAAKEGETADDPVASSVPLGDAGLGPSSEITAPPALDTVETTTTTITSPPPIIEVSSTDAEHSELPTLLTTHQEEASPPAASGQVSGDEAGDSSISPSHEGAQEPVADGQAELTSATATAAAVDDGGESDAFQTPTEETATHPIDDELASAPASAPEVAETVDVEGEKDRSSDGAGSSTSESPAPETKSATEEPSPEGMATTDIATEPFAPSGEVTEAPDGIQLSSDGPSAPPSAAAPPPLPRRAAARRPIPPPPGSAAAAAVASSAASTAQVSGRESPVEPELSTREETLGNSTPSAQPPPPRPRRAPAGPPASPAGEAAPGPEKASATVVEEDEAAKARAWEVAAWRELAAVRERLFWTRIGQEPSD